MSFLSSIGSFVSSVGSTISSAVSSIGSGISSFASKVAPVLGSVLSKVPPVLGPISQWANAIGNLLNIFHPDEKVEDIGDRALQAANSEQEIKPEKFEKFDDYINSLRNFELDPEKSKETPQAVKVTAGLGVATLGLEDKFNLPNGSLNSVWLLPIANSGYFTPERIKSLLENAKLIGDVGAYLEKRMSGEEARDFKKSFEFTPDGKPMDNTELGKLYDALDSARTEWAELNKKIQVND